VEFTWGYSGTGYVDGFFAIDETHVYAADSDPTEGTMVFALPLSGGPPTILAEGAGVSVRRLAVNSTHVFWTDGNVKGVSKVPKTGGTPVTVASTASGDPIAIVADNGSVVWVDNSDGTIKTVSVSGGSPTTLAEAPGAWSALAVDASKVCWSEYDVDTGAIACVPTAGGSKQTVATDQPFVESIAIKGPTVFWTADGEVRSAPLSGGTTTVWAGPGTPRGIAVDDTHVYWSVDYEGLLLKAPLGGGAATTVATAMGNLYQVEVDGTSLYWAGVNYVARITPK
jgi:hypothetical protein